MDNPTTQNPLTIDLDTLVEQHGAEKVFKELTQELMRIARKATPNLGGSGAAQLVNGHLYKAEVFFREALKDQANTYEARMKQNSTT